MIKRKKPNNSIIPYSSRKTALRALLIMVIVIGIWMTATNAGSFLKGFLLYQGRMKEAYGYSIALSETLDEAQEGEAQDVLSYQGDYLDRSEEEGLLPEDAPSLYEKRNASRMHLKDTKQVLYPIRPEPGEEFGELYIPKLKASLPIIEGTDADELEKGVGHFSDSVLPGEEDNSVLSGHRDTVFRDLGKIGKGDQLIVRTSAGEFTYIVNKVRIVDQEDRTVIVPKPSATLTVSTCYPFSFIGSAPKRYTLSAYLASEVLYE